MVLCIYTEPYYHKSVWCKEILDAMYSEANRKRLNIVLLSEFTELETFSNRSKSAYFPVFLIGTTFRWLSESMSQVSRHGAHPIIVSNLPPNAFQGTYSYISSDLQGATQFVISYLKGHNRNRIAFYGVNMESMSDVCKADYFAKNIFMLKNTPGENHIYVNQGSMDACFHSFIPFANNYDAVICANDYASICLVQKLKKLYPEKLNELFITSFTDTLISEMYSPSITSLSPNFYKFGKAAVKAFKYMQKSPEVSAMQLLIKWSLHVRETTNFLPYQGDTGEWGNSVPQSIASPPDEMYSFYHDEEVNNLHKLETIFRCCDHVDFSILSGMLQEKTYQCISDENYISESSVKYRIKKLLDCGSFSSRKEMLSILKEFICYENINKYIKTIVL